MAILTEAACLAVVQAPGLPLVCDAAMTVKRLCEIAERRKPNPNASIDQGVRAATKRILERSKALEAAILLAPPEARPPGALELGNVIRAWNTEERRTVGQKYDLLRRLLYCDLFLAYADAFGRVPDRDMPTYQFVAAFIDAVAPAYSEAKGSNLNPWKRPTYHAFIHPANAGLALYRSAVAINQMTETVRQATAQLHQMTEHLKELHSN